MINLKSVRRIMPKIAEQLTEASEVINPKGTRAILGEIEHLIKQLDGVDLDERTAVETGGSGGGKQRARFSQDLNLLADRFGYAAQLIRIQAYGQDDQTAQYVSLLADRLALCQHLVRAQYWAARGHNDPAAPHTTDGDGIDRFQEVLRRAPANGSQD